jgi:hypothetical protein
MGNSSYHILFTPRARYFLLPRMSKRISPAKSWCFTLNNYTNEEHGSVVQRFYEISEKNSNFFFIVGKEIGKCGTPHLQGYITYNQKNYKFRPLPMFSVKRDGVECTRFFKAKGDSIANYRYCSKDGDFVTNMPKPYMNEEEAQKIWDEPTIEPPVSWACSKEDWAAFNDQLHRKEEAALVLLKAADALPVYP